MKTILTFFFLLLFCGFSGWAQPLLPAKPEDISPLLIGEKVPAASLQNNKGEKADLLSLMAAKPTVLIFYRGGWCPYCNQHLSQIGEAETKILAMGYQILAISPDQPAKLLETVGKQKLNYMLLSDSAGSFSKAMGLAYQAPGHYLKIISEASNGGNKESLPVPALFVVNTKGEIVFEYIQPNFKVRMSSKMLLAVLGSL
jgi:peroxiredoxin